ncbi:MAG: hypothetical protein AAF938_21685, partial [Myxococcota bacterium]
MPLLFDWTFAFIPKELLSKELAECLEEGEPPWFARPSFSVEPAVGFDHDYPGQFANQLTRMKLRFLARLHHEAHDSTEESADQKLMVTRDSAKRIVGPSLRLDEAFFDARWEVVPLGAFAVSLDANTIPLESLYAVSPPNRPVKHGLRSPMTRPDYTPQSNPSFREEWEAGLQDRQDRSTEIVDAARDGVEKIRQALSAKSCWVRIPQALAVGPQILRAFEDDRDVWLNREAR